jgi:hypothetical protein
MNWDFKGTVFKKKSDGWLYAWVQYGEQFTKKFLKISLKQKFFYAYTENTLNGEISAKSVDISVSTLDGID